MVRTRCSHVALRCDAAPLVRVRCVALRADQVRTALAGVRGKRLPPGMDRMRVSRLVRYRLAAADIPVRRRDGAPAGRAAPSWSLPGDARNDAPRVRDGNEVR